MGSSKMIKLGFVGFGTVGQSTFIALERNLYQIKQQMGYELEVVSVAVKDSVSYTHLTLPTILLV